MFFKQNFSQYMGIICFKNYIRKLWNWLFFVTNDCLHNNNPCYEKKINYKNFPEIIVIPFLPDFFFVVFRDLT